MSKKLKEFLSAPSGKHTIAGIGVVIVVLLAFAAGQFVGLRKALFAEHFAGNFYRDFEKPRGERGMGLPKMMGNFPDSNLPGGHGAVGQIIRVNLPTFVIAEPNQTEKIISLDDETVIRQFREEVKSSTLSAGQMVAVIGEPNDQGVIEAKLIRLLPPVPATASTTKR